MNSYTLDEDRIAKLKKAVEAALRIPVIDGVEDYIWEAIFCYVKDIVPVDPLANTRSKKLFDIVDSASGIGWSAKALSTTLQPTDTDKSIEIVIQRAHLSAEAASFLTNPDPILSAKIVGESVLSHWRAKVSRDLVDQNVTNPRVCILVKCKHLKAIRYHEDDLTSSDPSQIMWQWSNDQRRGLQGFDSVSNKLIYRWYPSQKQLFEVFHLSAHSPYIPLSQQDQRIPLREFFELIGRHRSHAADLSSDDAFRIASAKALASNGGTALPN